ADFEPGHRPAGDETTPRVRQLVNGHVDPPREREAHRKQRDLDGTCGSHGGVERDDPVAERPGDDPYSPPGPSFANGDWTCQNGPSSVVTTSSTTGSFASRTRSSSPTRSLIDSTRTPTQPIACAIRA